MRYDFFAKGAAGVIPRMFYHSVLGPVGFFGVVVGLIFFFFKCFQLAWEQFHFLFLITRMICPPLLPVRSL